MAKAFYIFSALLCFAVSLGSMYAIQMAQTQVVPALFVYLAIAGIIGGLGGGVALLMQAVRAGSRHW